MKFNLSLSARAVTAAVLIAGCVFCLAVDWPGHVSYDSVIQLLEGRTGVYANWHPPIMSWLLGLSDAVLPGAGLFVAGLTVLGFGTLLLIAFLTPKVWWGAAAVALVIVLSPQFLLYQGIVWKDVLFADAAVASFACLGQAAVGWPNPRRRFGWLAATVLLLSLCGLARQNGAVVTVTGACAAGWIAAAWERPALKSALLYGGAALLAVAVMTGGANLALSTRIAGTSGPGEQFKRLELYDLVAAVKRDPGLPLGALARGAPALERGIRTDGVRLFTPSRNDTLVGSQRLQDVLDDTSPQLLRRQWLDLILHHPLLYLAVRANLFVWVWLTPNIEACAPYAVGVSGPPGEMRTLGLTERWDDRDDALDNYAKALEDTPFFSHGFFGALAVLAGLLMFWRGKPADRAMGGMMAGAVLYTLSFFVISIACDYRYLYALDLSAMAGVFYLSLEAPAWWAFACARTGSLTSKNVRLKD